MKEIDFSSNLIFPDDDDYPDVDFSSDDLDIIHLCLNLRKRTLSEYLSLPDLKRAERRDINLDINHISSLIDQIEDAMPDQEFSWHRGPISYDD